MASGLTMSSSRDSVLDCDVYTLEGEMVTATLQEFDSGGVLKMEYVVDDGGVTQTETYDVPDEVRMVDIYTEDDVARMVVNSSDYGF